MPGLPDSEIFLLVRTYFGSDESWEALRAVVEEGSPEGFVANVVFVDDRQFEGFPVEELEAVHPHRIDAWDVMYVADERAASESGHPLLVVRVGNTEDVPFRCRADGLYEVDANLSLANLDWDDFRRQIAESGAYGAEIGTGRQIPRAADPTVEAYQTASTEQVAISVPPDAMWEICEDLSEAAANADGEGKQIMAIAAEIVRRINEAPGATGPQDPATVTLSAAEWVFIRERAARRQSRPKDPGYDRRPGVRKVIAVIGLQGL